MGDSRLDARCRKACAPSLTVGGFIIAAVISAVLILQPPVSARAETFTFELTIEARHRDDKPSEDAIGLTVKGSNIPKDFINTRGTLKIWHQDSDSAVYLRKFRPRSDGSFNSRFKTPKTPLNSGRWRAEVEFKAGTENFARAEAAVQINLSKRALEREEQREDLEKIFKAIKKTHEALENTKAEYIEKKMTGKNFNPDTWQEAADEAINKLRDTIKMQDKTRKRWKVDIYSNVRKEIRKIPLKLSELRVVDGEILKGAKRIAEEIKNTLTEDQFSKLLRDNNINPGAPDAMKQLVKKVEATIEERLKKAQDNIAKSVNRISDGIGIHIITAKHLVEDLARVNALLTELFSAYRRDGNSKKFTPAPKGRWLEKWMEAVEKIENTTAPRYTPAKITGISNTYAGMDKQFIRCSKNLLLLREHLLKELYKRHNVPGADREEFSDSREIDPLTNIKTAYDRLTVVVNSEREIHVEPLLKVHQEFNKIIAAADNLESFDSIALGKKVDAVLERAEAVFKPEIFRYTLPRDVVRDIRGQARRILYLRIFAGGIKKHDAALNKAKVSGNANEKEIKILEDKLKDAVTCVEILKESCTRWGGAAVELLEGSLLVEPLPQKPELREPGDTESTTD